MTDETKAAVDGKSVNMENAMEVFAGGALPVKYRLDEVSLLMPDGVDFEVVQRVLSGMKTFGESVRFWIGDLLVYAERNYGEMASQLLGAADYSDKSIADMIWVSNAVAPEIRRKALTWSHHREVAKLDREKQDHYLGLAVENEWSVLALHEAIADKEHVKKGNNERRDIVFERALVSVVRLAKESSFYNEALATNTLEDGSEISPESELVTRMAMRAEDALSMFRKKKK